MANNSRKCSVDGCEGKHVARGFCMKHYQQQRWHGKVKPKKSPAKIYDNDEAKLQDVPTQTVLINNSRYVMASECHGAITTEGEKHSIGKQYCTECGSPCYWRWKDKNDFPKVVQKNEFSA